MGVSIFATAKALLDLAPKQRGANGCEEIRQVGSTWPAIFRAFSENWDMR